MKTAIVLLSLGIGLAGCDRSDTSQTSSPPAAAAASNDVTSVPATQPDNTGVNARDRATDAPTAGMQGQGKTDVQMTADIRQKVMAAKMSVNAQNVKIVTQSGKVTLRGPVNSQDEKDSIGRMANDVAGAANVDNELDIKPNG
jgi:hyperosmotically inducible protein